MGLNEIRKLKIEAFEPKSKVYYTIPKVSKKRAAKIIADKEILKLDEELRKIIWAAAPHLCENCNIHLGNTYKKWNFHHLLPKADYPQFRHTPENVVLLCLECHSKCETNIDFAPKIKQRRLQIEKELLTLERQQCRAY